MEYLAYALAVLAAFIGGGVCFAFGYLYGRRSSERELIIGRYYRRVESELPPRPGADWAEDATYKRLTGRR